MAKKKVTQRKVNLPKQIYLESLARLPKPAAAKVSKEIKKQLRLVSKHFNTPGNGWDLDFSFIREDLVYSLLGYHPADLMMFALANKGYKLSLENNRLMVSK